MGQAARSREEIRASISPDARWTHRVDVEYAEEMFGFSPSQILALKLISHGVDEGEIPAVTGFEYETVKFELKLMRQELRAKNNAHLVAIAFRNLLIT